MGEIKALRRLCSLQLMKEKYQYQKTISTVTYSVSTDCFLEKCYYWGTRLLPDVALPLNRTQGNFGHAWESSPGRGPGGIPTTCPSQLICLILTRRSSSCKETHFGSHLNVPLICFSLIKTIHPEV